MRRPISPSPLDNLFYLSSDFRCNEDYHWWWRSYLSAASSGGYLFLYAVWYFWAKLHISGPVGAVLYFAYMSMVALTFSLLTGSVGFFACLWFVRKIYGAIKVD